MVRVVVFGEAAELQSGANVWHHIARGAADEPPWVSGRIDAVADAIHRRLQGYAVAAPPPR